jgi:hypothetical protein
MKSITFRAEEVVIEAARRRAQQDHMTLNEAFRRWLTEYSNQSERARRYDEVMSSLHGSVSVGHKLTREARNER